MNTDPQTLDPKALRQVVQEKYGEAARTAQKGAASSCGCGCSSATGATGRATPGTRSVWS